MRVNHTPVKIEEVQSVLTPADGVSVEQALADANISGAQKVEMRDGQIIVTWFKGKHG